MSSQEIKDGQKNKQQESPKKKVEGYKKIRYSFSLGESDSDSDRNSSEDSDRGRGTSELEMTLESGKKEEISDH